MNQKLTNTLPSLAVGGLLLGLGLLTATPGARTADPETAPLVDALEAETRELTGELDAAARQHKRRARASLAMPYFSFGQSLRPRG